VISDQPVPGDQTRSQSFLGNKHSHTR